MLITFGDRALSTEEHVIEIRNSPADSPFSGKAMFYTDAPANLIIKARI